MKSHIKDPKKGDEIWFLEHEKVFTLGTAANKEHLLSPKDIPVVKSDRGGEVTYHGPGQLVIYFLLDIKKHNLGPKTLVKNIQSFQYFERKLLNRYLLSYLLMRLNL